MLIFLHFPPLGNTLFHFLHTVHSLAVCMCVFLSETFVAGGGCDCFNSSGTGCLCSARYSHVQSCLAES